MGHQLIPGDSGMKNEKYATILRSPHLRSLEICYLSPARGSLSFNVENHCARTDVVEYQVPLVSSSKNTDIRGYLQGFVKSKIYSMKHGVRNKLIAEATMSY